jgi:hypothetical protein
MRMSGIDLEIEMDKLGSLPLYPPRRRFVDFVPTFIMSWIRHKYSWPKATPREAWAVKGLLLRVAFNTQKTAAALEATPKPYFLSEAKAVLDEASDPDPFRFN